MASNYSSYSTPYSSQYYPPYSSYTLRPSPISNGTPANLRSRSLSFNDLSRQAQRPASFYYMQPLPVNQSVTTLPHSVSVSNCSLKSVQALPIPNHTSLAQSPSSTAQHPPPTTLSRYRGKHMRAMSAGSLPDDSTTPLAQQERHTQSIQPLHTQRHRRSTYNGSISSSDISIDTESLRTQTSASSTGSFQSWPEDDKLIAVQPCSKPPLLPVLQVSALSAPEQAAGTKPLSLHKSVSEPQIIVNTKLELEPLNKPTKSNKQSIRKVSKPVEDPNDSSNSIHEPVERAPVVSDAGACNEIRPLDLPSTSPKNKPAENGVRTPVRTHSMTLRVANPSNTAAPAERSVPRPPSSIITTRYTLDDPSPPAELPLVLPSDSRPRSYCLASNSSRESLTASMQTRKASGGKCSQTSHPWNDIINATSDGRVTPPPDDDAAASSSLAAQRISRIAKSEELSRSPTPVEPAPAKKSPDFMKKSYNKPPTRSQTPIAAPVARSPSLPALSTRRTMSDVPVQTPPMRHSRSFGSKLREIFTGKSSSKSKSKSDDDDSDARSVLSTKSSFSIKSASSAMSFSRFRRKRQDSDAASVMSSVSSVSQLAQPVPSSRRNSAAAMARAGDYGHKHSRSDSRVGVKSSPVMMAATAPPATSPPPRAESVGSQRVSPSPVSDIGQKSPEIPALPRPPSPALRSAIPSFDSSSSGSTPPVEVENYAEAEAVTEAQVNRQLSARRSGNHEAAPPNLTAGDIFPKNLQHDAVETIVSSVERTGSFKRQPSTTRRTPEEVVPNAQEIEIEKPKTVAPSKPKLQSAMKSRKQASVRRRSGATSNRSVSFASQILVYKTYSAHAYDRTPDRMTCDMLGRPGVAQQLREELNHWKLLMQIHPESRDNTQYFQV